MQENELNDLWDTEELEISKDLTESSLKSLLMRISLFELLESKQQKRRRMLVCIYSIASVVLLPLLIFSTLYFVKPRITTTYISDVIYSAPQGESQRIVLPDSTVVYLNSGSLLIAPEKLVSDVREVVLIGEAYFKVAKNKEKPFKVRTQFIDVEALGTEFSVLAYPHSSNIKTTLVEGSVIIRATAPQYQNIEPVILLPNQQSWHNPHQNTVSVKNINPSIYTSWIDGDLIFDKTPLEEVVERLEIQWGKDINYNKELSNSSISAKFIHDESLDEILNLLCQITNTQLNTTNTDTYQIK